jgi:hypothetical protein
MDENQAIAWAEDYYGGVERRGGKTYAKGEKREGKKKEGGDGGVAPGGEGRQDGEGRQTLCSAMNTEFMKIKPRKGSAILFYSVLCVHVCMHAYMYLVPLENTGMYGCTCTLTSIVCVRACVRVRRPNGEHDPLAVHGGCPVISGTKFISQQVHRRARAVPAATCLCVPVRLERIRHPSIKDIHCEPSYTYLIQGYTVDIPCG